MSYISVVSNIHIINSYIAFVISTTSNILLILLILKKTPDVLKPYRFILIQTCLIDLFVSCIMFGTKPVGTEKSTEMGQILYKNLDLTFVPIRLGLGIQTNKTGTSAGLHALCSSLNFGRWVSASGLENQRLGPEVLILAHPQSTYKQSKSLGDRTSRWSLVLNHRRLCQKRILQDSLYPKHDLAFRLLFLHNNPSYSFLFPIHVYFKVSHCLGYKKRFLEISLSAKRCFSVYMLYLLQ